MGDFDTGDAHSNPFTRENIFAIFYHSSRYARDKCNTTCDPGKDTSLVAPNTLERPASRSYESSIKKPARYALIILDKFGYVPLDVKVARQLLKVISARCGRRSILFATNVEFGNEAPRSATKSSPPWSTQSSTTATSSSSAGRADEWTGR